MMDIQLSRISTAYACDAVGCGLGLRAKLACKQGKKEARNVVSRAEVSPACNWRPGLGRLDVTLSNQAASLWSFAAFVSACLTGKTHGSAGDYGAASLRGRTAAHRRSARAGPG